MRKQVQKENVPNTIIFFRHAGDKIYNLDWAAFSAIPGVNGIELFFYVRGEEIEEGNLVNAEVSIFVDEFDLDTLAGKHFEVSSSYDNERKNYVSCVYYYDQRLQQHRA